MKNSFRLGLSTSLQFMRQNKTVEMLRPTYATEQVLPALGTLVRPCLKIKGNIRVSYAP